MAEEKKSLPTAVPEICWG